MLTKQQHTWERRIVFFLISQAITLFGSTLVQMAIIWYVTIGTSSGVWVAAFTVCSYLPQFFISFLGGVWADRLNSKGLIVGADLAIATATLLLIVVMPYLSGDTMVLNSLLVISAFRSLATGIQTPAVHALIPRLVPREHLMCYNGFNTTLQSMVQFAAPAVAGVVLSISTLRFTMFLDVVTAVIGVGIVVCLVLPKHQKVNEKVSVFEQMHIGFKYVYAHKMLVRLLVVYAGFIFLTVPGGFLAGLLVRRSYGDTYWHLTAVELIGFAGMVIGGVLMSVWGGFSSKTKTLYYSLFAFGVCAIGMGGINNFNLYLLFMLFYGMAMTSAQTSMTTLFHEHTKVSMQGRVFGLLSSMYSGFLPLGMMLFGPLADMLPLQWIIIGSGVFLMLIALAIRFHEYKFNIVAAP